MGKKPVSFSGWNCLKTIKYLLKKLIQTFKRFSKPIQPKKFKAKQAKKKSSNYAHFRKNKTRKEPVGMAKG